MPCLSVGAFCPHVRTSRQTPRPTPQGVACGCGELPLGRSPVSPGGWGQHCAGSAQPTHAGRCAAGRHAGRVGPGRAGRRGAAAAGAAAACQGCGGGGGDGRSSSSHGNGGRACPRGGRARCWRGGCGGGARCVRQGGHTSRRAAAAAMPLLLLPSVPCVLAAAYQERTAPSDRTGRRARASLPMECALS